MSVMKKEEEEEENKKKKKKKKSRGGRDGERERGVSAQSVSHCVGGWVSGHRVVTGKHV